MARAASDSLATLAQFGLFGTSRVPIRKLLLSLQACFEVLMDQYDSSSQIVSD